MYEGGTWGYICILCFGFRVLDQGLRVQSVGSGFDHRHFAVRFIHPDRHIPPGDSGFFFRSRDTTRKVAIRQPGKRNSNYHGARPVHQIIFMMKWIRTSRLSIKNSLSGLCFPVTSSYAIRGARLPAPLPSEDGTSWSFYLQATARIWPWLFYGLENLSGLACRAVCLGSGFGVSGFEIQV